MYTLLIRAQGFHVGPQLRAKQREERLECGNERTRGAPSAAQGTRVGAEGSVRASCLLYGTFSSGTGFSFPSNLLMETINQTWKAHNIQYSLYTGKEQRGRVIHTLSQIPAYSSLSGMVADKLCMQPLCNRQALGVWVVFLKAQDVLLIICRK